MNHDENSNDNTLTLELRDALSDLATSERPSLATMTSRARAHQRQRLAAFSGLGITGVAAATALALTGAFGATSARSTGAIHAAAPARGTGTSAGTTRTAAFVLTSNVNGTDTLTLTMSQVLNPATLQQALTQHGIPALVETDTYCSSKPAAPDPVRTGVLSGFQPPAGVPHTMVPAPVGPAPSQVTQLAARTVTVINPAAIPTGTELFFGYSTGIHAVFTDLIYTLSYTCSSNP
jgi:hypothetical protein